MGEPLVDQNQLEQIGSYVKSHLGEWIREGNVYPFPHQGAGNEHEVLRKIDNVEGQLKFHNEKLEQMMVRSDKRFETIQHSMDRRFEDLLHFMDRRLGLQTWIIGGGFTLMGTLITLFKFLG